MILSLFVKLLNRGSRHESHLFNENEARNVILYIIGIMFYKFALETYLGSISITAADRFPKENAFALLGALQGANQACQCIGSLMVAPLVLRFQTNRVLGMAIWVFCIMAVALLICEGASDGTLTTKGMTLLSLQK